MRADSDRVWTEAEIRALGVRTDVATAASIFGVCKAEAYVHIKAGEFPVPPLRIGRRILIPVAPILRVLGYEDAPAPTA